MIAMTLIGAAIGGIAFALIWRLAPPRVSPLTALARFDLAQTAASTTNLATPDEADSAMTRVGRLITHQLRRHGIVHATLRQDLALTGSTLEEAMGRKVIYACTALVGSLTLLAAGQLLLDVSLPAGSSALTVLAAAVAGFFVPDIQARTTAARRRTDFRRALGAYLDLVSLEMAGSAAPAEALPSAAKVGSGWPLALIRDTLYRATRSGRDQWSALADLGAQIGVAELRDLGHLVSLVAHDGARVRRTLTARAATMRRRELADLAEQAGQQDNSMRLAQVVIAIGFIVFIGYPAVAAILAF